MKKLISTALVLLFVAFLNAQSAKIETSAGPSIFIPTGVMTLINGIGFGADFTASKPVTDNIKIFATTGIAIFNGKNFIGSKTGSATHIPAIVGARLQSNKFLFGLGLGYAIYMYSKDADGYKEPNESGLTFRPQIGFNATEKLDVLLNYTSTTTTGLNSNYVSLGVHFKL